jgi:RNA ligase (TIGR02306 family)
MDTGRSIAVQGEIMGPGIQGNREDFKDVQFFVFDIFDIDRQCYVDKDDRHDILAQLKLPHVPILQEATTLDELGITNVAELLAFAEGPSINHKVREGLVFKRVDGGFSFKAISNKFLAGEKD